MRRDFGTELLLSGSLLYRTTDFINCITMTSIGKDTLMNYERGKKYL